MSLLRTRFPAKLALVSRLVTRVFPAVEQELDRWRTKLDDCRNRELASQAHASIRHKRFHAQGGSVYALAYGGFNRDLVRLIVALQTISDYLDNLCDRAGCLDQQAFRQLHDSMTAAVNPTSEIADFYRYYPYHADGGYLNALIGQCRSVLQTLPSYHLAREDVIELVGLYSDLQVYKHTHLSDREPLLINWFDVQRHDYPDLHWWEFAAATGSTLAMFALFATASRTQATTADVQHIRAVYFPWVCGLHILLDYFIDQEEDRQGGDLNFVSYYRDATECRDRLQFFVRRALDGVSGLPRPLFHRTVVKGLLALYLSDPKVKKQGLQWVAHDLIHTAGRDTALLYHLCRALRRFHTI